MTIEEKARVYDEAIKKAKAWCACEHATTDDKILLKRIFPELEESEDERIRKEIIDFATKVKKGLTSILVNNYDFNKWIAWLEKQYKKDEEIILLKDKIESLESARIAMQECHRLELEKLEEQGEQKPAEWSEEDKCMLNNVIDTLKPLSQTTHSGYAINSMIDWLKSLKNRYAWKPDSSMLICLEYAIKHINKDGDKRILSKLLEQLKQL